MIEIEDKGSVLQTGNQAVWNVSGTRKIEVQKAFYLEEEDPNQEEEKKGFKVRGTY